MGSRKSIRTHAVPTNGSNLFEEVIFWLCLVQIFYALIVPLLAIDSMRAAEVAMQFGGLNQLAAIFLLILAIIWFGKGAIDLGGKRLASFGVLGWFAILLSIQPSSACCGTIVACIAGFKPFAELTVVDIAIHLLPMIGGGLLILDLHLQKTPRLSRA